MEECPGPNGQRLAPRHYGFTDDDHFVGVVRFVSRGGARANPHRPEGEWGERMVALFDGPVEFHDCGEVTMFLDGDASQGEFVQSSRARSTTPAG